MHILSMNINVLVVIAAKHAASLACSVLRPVQLGVGIVQGYGALVHACREYLRISLQYI